MSPLPKRPQRVFEGRKPQALGRSGTGMNTVGSRVREARFQQEPQWSLEDLSKALLQSTGLDLTPSTLGKIERGERSVYDYEVVAFCRTFEVEPQWLLGMAKR